jgi:WD40 repeat protein
LTLRWEKELSPLIAMILVLALLPAHSVTQEQAMPRLVDRPVLTIELGMHRSAITGASLDAAGDLVVTGSYDGTVRVWSLIDGKLLRTLRLPIGTGGGGRVYSVAISPDGGMVAAGGWTTEPGSREQIYIFDRNTGELSARIAGLPDVVNHLAFSPDGRYLAATLGGPNGLRVYDQSAN